MPSHRSIRLFNCCAALILAALPGCMLAEPFQQTWFATKQAVKSDGGLGVPNPADQEDKSWRYVAEEGRPKRPVEKDPEQWYRKYVMSEKAREVERNFGIE